MENEDEESYHINPKVMTTSLITQVFRDKCIRVRIFKMVSVIHRILRLNSVKWPHLSMDFLTRYRYYDTIKYIVSRQYFLKSLKLARPLRMSHVELSRFCRDNHSLDLFAHIIRQPQWFFGERIPLSDQMIFNYCCHSGSLDIVQYLHQAGYSATIDAVKNAAESGNVELVKFLCENRSEGCNQEAMDAAVQVGNLEIVEYLSKFQSWNCKIYPQNIYHAACNGHVKLVRFLDCTGWDRLHAMQLASSNGHLEMVIYIWKLVADKRETEVSMYTWVEKATENGHIEVVRYLVEQAIQLPEPKASLLQKFGLAPKVEVSTCIKERKNSLKMALKRGLKNAATNKHLKIIEFLADDPFGLDVNLSSCILGEIAVLGNVQILQKYYKDFLAFNNGDISNNSVNLDVTRELPNQYMQTIIQNGYVSILDFLYQRNLVTNTKIGTLLPVAVGYLQLAMVDYILGVCTSIEESALSLAFEETIKQDLYQIFQLLYGVNTAQEQPFKLEKYLSTIKLYEPSDIIWWLEQKLDIKDILNYTIKRRTYFEV